MYCICLSTILLYLLIYSTIVFVYLLYYCIFSRQEGEGASIVVIPPMQICPGDLLIYSRVLTHKSSIYGNNSNRDLLIYSRVLTHKIELI